MSHLRIVVAGIAGSGKTTIARALAEQLGAVFVEGDSEHPSANVAKMANGTPLTDEDRWPWLAALRGRLRSEERIVLTCSALRRSYRDVLRGAGDVRFVFLDVDRDVAVQRATDRPDHYMGPEMIDSQLSTLEPPEADEIDIAKISCNEDIEDVVESALRSVQSSPTPAEFELLLSIGGPDGRITSEELDAYVSDLVETEILHAGVRRVLLVPPDHTRLHSRAGEITGILFRELTASGCDVSVLPALGTHTEMSPDDVRLLFGDSVPYDKILHHRWRDSLVHLGEISADEVSVLSGGRYSDPIPVEVDEILFDDWDLVISIGQVVPHEVIGMANFTKNIVIGLGGASTVHRSHFLGAASDMEAIMGRASSPVRDVVDAAFDRFIAPTVNVLWLLTVMEDTSDGIAQRGLFAGRGRSTESGGAAYRKAADLAIACNVDTVDAEFTRVACWLDPDEFRSTWLGNKAIYRTRMAIADDGELIVLAPGVRNFGEDPAIDRLIRSHGYRGTDATLAGMATDDGLAVNLGAAAHLIHGSSEGRFRVVYCTDPSAGGLTRAEVEGVGYEWRSLPEEMERLGVGGETASGPRADADGQPFDFIANPALGLWAIPERLA